MCWCLCCKPSVIDVVFPLCQPQSHCVYASSCAAHSTAARRAKEVQCCICELSTVVCLLIQSIILSLGTHSYLSSCCYMAQSFYFKCYRSRHECVYVVQCVFVWFCLKNLGYNLYGLQSTVSCCLVVLYSNFNESVERFAS